MSQPSPPKGSNLLAWANEVMEVYGSLGSLAGSRTLSTPSANYLFEWAQREENETKFLSDLVPKATALIAKNEPTEVADAIREIDVKTIAELQSCLREALKASEKGDSPTPEIETVDPLIDMFGDV